MTIEIIDAHTVERVQFEVNLISSIIDDPEYAHSCEDRLYRSVLACIAKGVGDDPQKLAEAALEAAKIEYPRWYA